MEPTTTTTNYIIADKLTPTSSHNLLALKYWMLESIIVSYDGSPTQSNPFDENQHKFLVKA